MRDPERIPVILHLIYRIWKKYPDLRLMQLILNAIEKDAGLCEEEIIPYFYNMEDSKLETKIRELYNDKL